MQQGFDLNFLKNLSGSQTESHIKRILIDPKNVEQVFTHQHI